MQNNNISISQDMNRIFDLKGESTNVIADFIQPIVKIDRTCNICRSAIGTNNTTSLIYTTPTDKDFYLCNCSLSFIKDITSTTTLISLNATIDGVERALILIPSITLTVHSGQISLNFNNPIKIDRNTSVVSRTSTNVANILYNSTIQGYTVETTK